MRLASLPQSFFLHKIPIPLAGHLRAGAVSVSARSGLLGSERRGSRRLLGPRRRAKPACGIGRQGTYTNPNVGTMQLTALVASLDGPDLDTIAKQPAVTIASAATHAATRAPPLNVVGADPRTSFFSSCLPSPRSRLAASAFCRLATPGDLMIRASGASARWFDLVRSRASGGLLYLPWSRRAQCAYAGLLPECA